MSEKEKKDREKRSKRKEKHEKDEKKSPKSISSLNLAISEDIQSIRSQQAELVSKIKESQERDARMEGSVPMGPSQQRSSLFAFGESVLAAFDQVLNMGRRLNATISIPEIVFVGFENSAKEGLIDALIGCSFNLEENILKKRTLYITVVHNASAQTPKFTVKSDSFATESDADLKSTQQVYDKLKEKNETQTTEPIYMTVDTKQLMNMILIVTPDMIYDVNNPLAAESETQVKKYIHPMHRKIIIARDSVISKKLEKGTQGQGIETDYLVELVKSVDPDFDRTTFVYTKLFHCVSMTQVTPYVNKFLLSAHPNSFFVTTPSSYNRAEYEKNEEYLKRIIALTQRDFLYLEQMQCDRKPFDQVGYIIFHEHFLNAVWRHYKNIVPSLLTIIRKNKEKAMRKDQRKEKMDHFLKPENLRGYTAFSASIFAEVIKDFISGSGVIDPSICGQTTEEETQSCGVQWTDKGNTIELDPSWKVSETNSKLYGGKQFKRLLEEFKAVADHITIPEMPQDESGKAFKSSLLWTAADFVKQRTQEMFFVLIKQLAERAKYIFNQISNHVEGVVKSKQEGHFDEYSYVIFEIKKNYEEYIEQLTEDTIQKCLDEFYSTKTILWDLSQGELIGEAQKEVEQIQKVIYDHTRDRICRNVIHKFFSFFLTPLYEGLSGFLQGRFCAMSDEAVTELFSTGNSERDDEGMAFTVDECTKLEAELPAVSKKFSF